MSFVMREFQPAAALRSYIQTYWHGQFNPARQPLMAHEVVPNGYIELIVHLGDRHCLLYQTTSWRPSPVYTLIGLFTQPYAVHFDDSVDTFGIRFHPEGIYTLFGIPAIEFSARYLDMEDVLDRSFTDFSNRLRETADILTMIRLTDAYLLTSLRDSPVHPYYLQHAAALIRETDGLAPVEDIPGQVFISHRQLEREFRDKLGITPKQYARMIRLNKANRLMAHKAKPDLTRISHESGFADQAHFIREFKHYAGVSPTRFLRAQERFIVNV